MKQSVSLITLGVSDYARAESFYAALGWSPALEIEETAFFQANGVVLVLWAREKLATDSGIADDGARWSGITLAHNVASRQEVEDVIKQARSAGGTIAREPSETFYGGYAGVFRDLDGHAGKSRTTPASASHPTEACSWESVAGRARKGTAIEVIYGAATPTSAARSPAPAPFSAGSCTRCRSIPDYLATLFVGRDDRA